MEQPICDLHGAGQHRGASLWCDSRDLQVGTQGAGGRSRGQIEKVWGASGDPSPVKSSPVVTKKVLSGNWAKLGFEITKR